MRPSIRLFLGAIAIACSLSFAACQNPFDPIDKSDKIKGLTWVEINGADLEGWDSDPEFDGLVVSIAYKNEFGEELSFHDKPHDVVIEFWTQKDIATPPNSYITTDKLMFSKTISYENSDDTIRIPYEAYLGQLQAFFDFSDPDVPIEGMLVVRVFPPEGQPREKLEVAEIDVVFYERPEGSLLTP